MPKIKQSRISFIFDVILLMLTNLPFKNDVLRISYFIGNSEIILNQERDFIQIKQPKQG